MPPEPNREPAPLVEPLLGPLLGAAMLLLSALAFVLALATLALAWSLLRPPRRTYASALRQGRPGDPSELPAGPRGAWRSSSWTFQSRGRTLHAWEIAGHDPLGPTFILTHGYGDSRIGALGRVPHLAPLASRIIAWDMPGHGESPGTCGHGLREPEDLRALIDHLGAAPEGLVLHGWSLGAGVSIAAGRASAQADIRAVIAESPYRHAHTPVRAVLTRERLPTLTIAPALLLIRLRAGVPAHDKGTACARLPLRWWSSSAFDRAELARGLRMPLLVIHGTSDDVSPPGDGRLIAEAAPHGEFVGVEGAGHYGLFTDPGHAARSIQAIARLLASLAPGGGR